MRKTTWLSRHDPWLHKKGQVSIDMRDYDKTMIQDFPGECLTGKMFKHHGCEFIQGWR